MTHQKQGYKLSIFFLLFLFTCEHFQGPILDPKSLIFVPGLEGRWRVNQERKEISVVRLKFEEETKSYLLEIDGETDRSLLRFAKIDERYIGEYHDLGENGEEIPAGHIFLLTEMDSGWQVILGSDISKAMVTKHKLIATAHKKYGTNPPSYFLSGSKEENRNALGKLITDPDFFRGNDTKKIMSLKRTTPIPSKPDPLLENFLKGFGEKTHADVTENVQYYEILLTRESGGAEKYRLDKKTGKSTMLWHEHPNR